MRTLRLIWCYLFPPVVLPGDDGRNAMMRRLLDGHHYFRPSVSAADVDARLAALRTPTAVEREEAEVSRALAEIEEADAREWEGRR